MKLGEGLASLSGNPAEVFCITAKVRATEEMSRELQDECDWAELSPLYLHCNKQWFSA